MASRRAVPLAILLPPSEGKAEGGRTPRWKVGSGSFGSAKVSKLLTPATLNFSNHDWTFATWFKRDSYADDDFLFYV